MEDIYYMVSIMNLPDEPVTCYPKTYEEASEIARPWAEQGYNVIITTREYEEEGEDID